MRIENENMSNTDYRGLFEVMFSDGRIILSFIGLLLLMTGIFVCVQSYIGEFLPHDTAFLGMNAITLGAINPKIVNFMFHDRVSFGSTIMSTGLLLNHAMRYGTQEILAVLKSSIIFGH